MMLTLNIKGSTYIMSLKGLSYDLIWKIRFVAANQQQTYRFGSRWNLLSTLFYICMAHFKSGQLEKKLTTAVQIDFCSLLMIFFLSSAQNLTYA